MTIYKKDTTGKIRQITITTEGDKVIQISGVVGSDKLVRNESVCIGKNIGKKNETSPEQQALLEATAKIKSKLDKEYHQTIEQAETSQTLLPMTGVVFSEVEDKIVFPCYVQPKLDGMRGLKDGHRMISRGNKEITTINHILNELIGVNSILDGEIYVHGLTFQDNMKLIKKYRKGETEQVKYHVYDMVLTDTPFIERYDKLKDLIESHNPANIVLVPTYIINNKEELLMRHSQFLSEGYEGSIVRWGETGYEINKESKSLVKFKDFLDLACEIVDVVPSEKRPSHGSFICKLPSGETFGTGMRFSHKDREDILINKQNYIGETAEIRFFEYSNDHVPRFPVCVGLRLDK